MNREFSAEQLAAYLLGLADERDRAAITAALPFDEELQAQMAFLTQLLPDAAGAGPQPAAESERTVGLDAEETALPAGAAPRYTRPLPLDLQQIAELHEQGLGPAEIAAQISRTRTLVSLKLQQLAKFRSSTDG